MYYLKIAREQHKQPVRFHLSPNSACRAADLFSIRSSINYLWLWNKYYVMMNIITQYMLQGYEMDVTKYRLLLYRQKNRSITGNILHV